MKNLIVSALTALVFAGCASDYHWRNSVPKHLRTVAVPTFRNESDTAELGALATRQILREFQREGTFSIRNPGNAAIEIQGVVKKCGANVVAYNRRSNLRVNSYEVTSVCEISVIDKTSGRVLVDNRPMTATTTMTMNQDTTTALRDASGRLADDLSRQVVDLVLGLNFKEGAKK